jgi:hypothetical protein
MHPYFMDQQFSGSPAVQNGVFPADAQFAQRESDEQRQSAGNNFAMGQMQQPVSVSQNGAQWPSQPFPQFSSPMQHSFPQGQPHPGWQQPVSRRSSEDVHLPQASRWPHQQEDFAMTNGMPSFAPPELMWQQMQQMQHAMAAAAMQYPAAARGWQQLAALAKTSDAVDYSLVEALRSRCDMPRTARTAIESLHGVRIRCVMRLQAYFYCTQVNGFPADAWKDYYLEHQERIDEQVRKTKQNGANGTHSGSKPSAAALPKVKVEPKSRTSVSAGGKPTTAKRPKVAEPSPSVSSESSESESESDASTAPRAKRRRAASPKTKTRVKRETSTPVLSKPSGLPGSAPPVARRATLNSLVSQYDAVPDDWNIAVPSRSPTPPIITTITPAERGKRQANKFTEEDRQYVIKFLTYELHKDPEAAKGELADKIGEKVSAGMFDYTTRALLLIINILASIVLLKHRFCRF